MAACLWNVNCTVWFQTSHLESFCSRFAPLTAPITSTQASLTLVVWYIALIKYYFISDYNVVCWVSHIMSDVVEVCVKLYNRTPLEHWKFGARFAAWGERTLNTSKSLQLFCMPAWTCQRWLFARRAIGSGEHTSPRRVLWPRRPRISGECYGRRTLTSSLCSQNYAKSAEWVDALSVSYNIIHCVFCTRSSRKVNHSVLVLTISNIDGFSKFFQWHAHL